MTDVEEGPNSQRTKITGDHGNVQLRDPVTNQLILIPPPSEDPKDPLNWSRGFRLFIAFIANTTVFLAQLISAGPSVNIMNMVHDLFNATPTHPKYPTLVAKVSYFFSGMVFLQSMSNLFYMPVIIKYGRRPVYIVSLLLFGACSLWAGLAKSYPSELAARLTLGFAGGSADSLAPLTITDIFFLHERGFIMRFSHNANHSHSTSQQISPHSLKIFNGPFTTESLWQLFWRPIPLLLLPPVLWGTLAQSVCISALVAVTTSSETAFSKSYHWTIWQCGLAYIATIIGALLSIFGSGWLSDTTADWLTRRNHGLREPEMRLPALILCSILCPLGIVLYGLGIGHGLPWIVPVLGLALCKIRRVKCGEERPSCLRCTSTGRKCDFKIEPIIFVNPSLSPNTGSRERRAFAYYFEFAASSIGGGLDLDFWRTVVPQVCRHEPAVWDAIISIGALFECSQKGPNLFLRQAGLKDLDQNHQDVLAWYARSVSAIRCRIEAGNVDAFVGLISCMLFICVEALQGDTGGAMQLFAQGVRLIMALRPMIASGAISASKAELLDDTIIPIFLRLAACALAIDGLPLDVLLENRTPQLFESLRSARNAIVSLAVEIPMFEAKCIDHMLQTDSSVVPDDLLAQRNVLASKLESWYTAFAAMNMNNSNKKITSEEIGAAALFFSYHEMLYVMLGTCTSMCLTNFDAFIPNFQRIVEQSAITLRASTRPDGTQPPFTFELSVGLPLWFTSLRCRDPQIRRLSLTLLHQAPAVQGFYQCSVGTAIGERVMGLEESFEMGIHAAQPVKTLEPAKNPGLEIVAGSSAAVEIESHAGLISEEARIGPITLFRPRDGLPKGTKLEDIAEWNRDPGQAFLRFSRNERGLADDSWRTTYKYVPFDHALPDLYYVVSCVDSEKPQAMVA
ncbi:unnamed protein product [Penicillium salamii]|nr:unnamed protein product [Penicillium salamii]